MRAAEANQKAAEATQGTAQAFRFSSCSDRARGDARDASDWNLGYVGDASLDADGLLSMLVKVLGTDRIDLVDLTHAGAQLRFRAVRDGTPLFAADARESHRFWFDAVSFWCDMQPVIRAEYGSALPSCRDREPSSLEPRTERTNHAWARSVGHLISALDSSHASGSLSHTVRTVSRRVTARSLRTRGFGPTSVRPPRAA